MKQYWIDYWLANVGCVPDGLDMMIIVGLMCVTSMITIKVKNRFKNYSLNFKITDNTINYWLSLKPKPIQLNKETISNCNGYGGYIYSNINK